MKISNQQQQAPITMNGRNLKEVVSFIYHLGSIISTTSGTDEDVKARIGKAKQDITNLKSVWRFTAVSMKCEQDPNFQHQFSQDSASIWFRNLVHHEKNSQQTTQIPHQ
ncbi:unnamed protein product [Heterobilharzia americana]|nr:unnamed protein product [Heterobilharzia americana]